MCKTKSQREDIHSFLWLAFNIRITICTQQVCYRKEQHVGGNEQLAYENWGFPFKYVRFTVCLRLIRFINIIIYTGQRHSSVKKVVLLQWSCREC